MRKPETLNELKAEILRQLEKSETITITLTEGDGIRELFESIADVIREQSEEKTIHVHGQLTPHQRDTITGAVKWIERIVNRKNELPPLFLDNTDPSPLAKELRAMLSENTEYNV